MKTPEEHRRRTDFLIWLGGAIFACTLTIWLLSLITFVLGVWVGLIALSTAIVAGSFALRQAVVSFRPPKNKEPK